MLPKFLKYFFICFISFIISFTISLIIIDNDNSYIIFKLCEKSFGSSFFLCDFILYYFIYTMLFIFFFILFLIKKMKIFNIINIFSYFGLIFGVKIYTFLISCV